MGTEFSGPMYSNLTLENETLKSTIENILMEVEVKEEVEVGFNVFWCVVSVDGSWIIFYIYVCKWNLKLLKCP